MYLKLATAKTANGIAPWMKSWKRFELWFGVMVIVIILVMIVTVTIISCHMMMVDSDLIPVVAPLHVTFVLCQLGCQQLGGSIDVDNLQFSILIDASYNILKVVKC